MPAALPDLEPAEFASGVQGVSPEPLAPQVLERLYGHYAELRRWSARMALVGPGSVPDLLARHYGESLAALPLLPPLPGRLVDIGSGAGFPGLVIAAARPEWRVVLVENRERKWAFLKAAARTAGLASECLNARVAAHLPAGFPEAFEVVTVRALSLPPSVLGVLGSRLRAGGRLILWVGARDPALPMNLKRVAEHALPGSSHRRLQVIEAA